MSKQKLDARYTVGQEFTGHISGRAQWVARFCGEWICAKKSKRAALDASRAYEAKRQAALGGQLPDPMDDMLIDE